VKFPYLYLKYKYKNNTNRSTHQETGIVIAVTGGIRLLRQLMKSSTKGRKKISNTSGFIGPGIGMPASTSSTLQRSCGGRFRFIKITGVTLWFDIFVSCNPEMKSNMVLGRDLTPEGENRGKDVHRRNLVLHLYCQTVRGSAQSYPRRVLLTMSYTAHVLLVLARLYRLDC